MTGDGERGGPAGSTALAFPPHVLREYAVVADGYRGAVIGPRGDVGWLCAPRWDSPAVFASLVGGRGTYAVTPADPFVWGGSYEPGSLIWRSHWVTSSTVIECREALAYPGHPDRLALLRRIEAADEPATVDIVLDLRADFGRSDPMEVRADSDGVWDIRVGGLRCRWSGAADARAGADGTLRLRLSVPPGGHHDLVLEISDRPLAEPVRADRAWESTERHWHAAVPTFDRSAAPRDSRHAYALLRGLTVPGGGMVAAATMGLPERAEAGRNYDYRYVWLRDQAYAGVAVGVDTPDPLLDEAVAFTTARVLEHGDRLAPAYRVDGRLPPDETDLGLPGYPGGKDIVGNWVRGQFQLDGLGEILQLFATAGRHDHLTSDDQRAVRLVIDLIERRWDDPDAGIWELDDAWWTHSRLACVAGLRVIARQVSRSDAARTSTLADTILAETSRRCLGSNGAWMQRPDHPGVDAALLLPPVRGALSSADPRSRATLKAVRHQLVEDGYVYRYAEDGQRLGQVENAFLMCGFAVCLAELDAGHLTESFRWFERQRAACGPPGLFAEEFDVRERQLRGNLPQAFVHALMLECSQRLGHAAE
ncbi:glycoside hydrolase family 15 protein [Microlunatus panaciterrae]|uniref:Glucoamylase (Glucan-1,4-alpha-glucosidase), GH15 family n=1 Tax=Microlunatus panaciterrae TaxID=400768 RepID=A0ABS2RK74_9ACTN|nr:glycoside hydrolase family 15 protein [Microlunatus panaciterrae]MBM7799118.1 hypothetical protein [Microlunatus panaciterrae]